MRFFPRPIVASLSWALACAFLPFTARGDEGPWPVARLDAAWSYATGGPVFSTAAHQGADLYIGSDDGHVHALDAHTGAPRWTQELSGPVRTRPWIDGAEILVVSGNDLAALSRESGRVIWQFKPEPATGAAPSDRWDYHQSSPVIAGGLVTYGAGNGRFYAVDRANGKERFSCPVDAAASIRSTPAYADGTLYFGDWNGVIYAVDAANGSRRWTFNTLSGPKPYPQFGGVVSSLVVQDGRLYFGARNPDVFCLDAVTGKEIWKFTAENGSWTAGTPTVDGGSLFITGSDDHRVHALDAATGAVRWSCDLGQNMFIAPLVVGTRVIVTDANSYADDAGAGRLHVLDRATGRRLRTFAIGGNAGASSPVLVEGRVVVGSEDGHVRAFDLATLLQ